MPKLFPMVAEVAFDRNGKQLQPGDFFDAYPIEAASLRFNKKASFASRSAAASQRLATRSMTARPTAPSAGSPVEAPREARTAPEQTAAAQAEQGAGGRSRRQARSQNYDTRQMGASKD